jgi:general L-amino acid transport system permease protein
LGCIFSTLLGLGVALARLSPNWLLKKLATYYIEFNRNIPVLMHLLFWYFIVFQQLPGVRESFTLFDTVFFTNRGVFIPRPLAQQSFVWVVLSLIAAVVSVCLLSVYVRRTRELTGRQLSILWPAVCILAGFPALVILIAGPPLAWDVPQLQGFNYQGGMVLTPEFLALLTGLTVYVSAFNAEIIRSGIQSVNKGQIEAGKALGLKDGRIKHLVTLPQALRVIMPPLTNEYLAVAKNSSLAVAIGYPDIVSVGGTILNQTGQSIEVISIWMLVYLIISLTISMVTNWYNAKIMLVER